MKVILTILSILFLPINLIAQEYLICEEDVFEDDISRVSVILDYSSLNDQNIILAFKINDFSTFFLEKIKSNSEIYLSFKESVKNDTFDFQTSEIAKLWDEDIRVYPIKILRKTPIQWYGVTSLREKYSRSSPSSNSKDFKINLLNGKAYLEIPRDNLRLNCKIIDSNLFCEEIKGFEEYYFKDQE